MISIGQFGNGIRQYFHTDPNKFLWRDGLLAFGEIRLDLLYMEDWLAQQSGYNPDASIRENIAKMYGEDAAHFVETII